MKNYIFTLWTGDNEMPKIREKALESILLNTNADVILVTKDNLNEFVSDSVPLHPAYPYLSFVHRSDYLRCYLMHLYGGGYCDLKFIENSWIDSFNKLKESTKYALGYKEVGAHGVAPCDNENDYQMLKNNWRQLIGMGAFIFKHNTALTKDWFDKLNEKLDIKYNELKANRGNAMGNNNGYPLKWTEILGNILHPLVLKYKDNIIQDNTIKPNFTKQYR